MIKNEIEVMRNSRHPNLVALYEVQQSVNYLYMFLEFCNGGTKIKRGRTLLFAF